VDYTAQQIFEPQDELQQLRFLELGTALKAFDSSPTFGTGLGSALDTPVLTEDGWTFVIIHNSFANMLASIGLVGMALMLYVVWKAWRLLVRYNHPKSPYLLAGFLALIWYGTFMAFQPIYSVYHLPVIVGFLYGMGLRSAALRSRESTPTSDLASMSVS
jgi:O-antigen ligase